MFRQIYKHKGFPENIDANFYTLMFHSLLYGLTISKAIHFQQSSYVNKVLMLYLPYLRVYPILYYFHYKKHYFLRQAHILFLLDHLLHLVLTMTTLFTVMTRDLHMLICIDDVKNLSKTLIIVGYLPFSGSYQKP